MAKEFNTLAEVKAYVRGFNNPDRYEVTVDGDLPAEEDFVKASWRERQGIAHDFEYIEVVYLDLLGNEKNALITIIKNVGCML